ncbi:SDR family oxidoreductase [Dactylosporangium sp. NPDC050688]|uniref:SDR family NAD(P)-dependent oxidoreductase n=1 Tax=Dactylosporangium sp. NPDC050688 TaxID=3157217 RepID=UPI0033F0C156
MIEPTSTVPGASGQQPSIPDSSVPPVVLVAGANGGIGSAVAAELAAAGARLHLGYHREHQAVDEVVDEVVARGRGDSVTAGRVDACDRNSVQRWMATALEAHGTVNALVSCVGTALPPVPFLNQDPADWRRILAVELEAVLTLTHVVAPSLIAGGGGRIAVLSSDSGRAGATGQVVSSAARGGVNALCKALARELARSGVTVNAVCPGPVAGAALDRLQGSSSGAVSAVVRAIPIRRVTTAQEVAAVFRFLVMDHAAAITGQLISVNGGLSMA